MQWMGWLSVATAVGAATVSAATVVMAHRTSVAERVALLATRMQRALLAAALIVITCYVAGFVVSFAAVASLAPTAEKASTLANTINSFHRGDWALLSTAALGLVVVRGRRSHLDGA